jgi:hypothetical protein
MWQHVVFYKQLAVLAASNFLVACLAYSLILKMEMVHSSEMS